MAEGVKKNIALIGMAGCGKSVVGKKLAYELGFMFLDLDDAMEIAARRTLPDLVATLGDKGFIKHESATLRAFLKTKTERTVIAPGGSIVLSPAAINELKKQALVIFINTPFNIIKRRTMRQNTRGAVVGLKNKTLEEVYALRLSLYKKYADRTIVVDHMNERRALTAIIKLLPKSMGENKGDRGADFF